jgi:glycosyltransferase involved in cell wall biosynthesis
VRILLVSGAHRAEIRGATVATHGLAHALQARGHEVDVLKAALPEHQRSTPGLRTLYVDRTRKSLYPLLFSARSLRSYDLVHSNDESGAFLALRQSVQRFPLVAQFQPPVVHGESFWQASWRWRYIGMSARLAPVLLTPSRWLADAMSERYGIEPERFRVIPYGIGRAWFDAYRPPVRRASGPLRVALVNMKGLDTALHAFAKASEGLDATLELYGMNKHAATALALARQLGIGERVHFAGFVPNTELAQRLAGCDVLLHPARSESFGQVLGEAAALGVPAVASRVNAVPEVVSDGASGFLCPVDDVEAFTKALGELLGSPDLRLRMGTAARERAEKLWRWEHVSLRIETEVYEPLRELVRRRR